MLLRATQRALRSGAREKSTVVMMRHGESTWNLENKFTGIESGAEGRRPSPSSPSTRGLRGVARRRAAAKASGRPPPRRRAGAAPGHAVERVFPRRLVRLPFI